MGLIKQQITQRYLFYANEAMFKSAVYLASALFTTAKDKIQLENSEYSQLRMNRLDILSYIWLIMRTIPKRLIWKLMKSCY